MPKKKPGRNPVTILLPDDEYEQLKLLSSKEHTSMSEVGRGFIIQGLNGELTQNNLEYLIPILREQIKNVIEPIMERQTALTAKTCIQAGTAAYLSADAILKFVPPAQREEVADSYEAARKKSLQYLKGKVPLDE